METTELGGNVAVCRRGFATVPHSSLLSRFRFVYTISRRCGQSVCDQRQDSERPVERCDTSANLDNDNTGDYYTKLLRLLSIGCISESV